MDPFTTGGMSLGTSNQNGSGTVPLCILINEDLLTGSKREDAQTDHAQKDQATSK